jgi:hypothetical protein
MGRWRSARRLSALLWRRERRRSRSAQGAASSASRSVARGRVAQIDLLERQGGVEHHVGGTVLDGQRSTAPRERRKLDAPPARPGVRRYTAEQTLEDRQQLARRGVGRRQPARARRRWARAMAPPARRTGSAAAGRRSAQQHQRHASTRR